MNVHVGIGAAEVERWASALGGAALAVYGLNKRSVAGAMIAASGGALIYHGATRQRRSRTPAESPDETKAALRGPRGINVEEAVTINRPAEELYRYWRDFENLPQFMNHLATVRQVDARRSHWVAKAPGGRTVEWDAEILNEIPNELIGWRTLDRSEVLSAGSVRFIPAGPDRGTRVHVRLQYSPPGGKLGAAIAWMLGEEPSQTIHEDLQRFKQLMEAGEVPTAAGQPRGKQSVLNYD
jgi:uncharacterized membrane protein